MRNARNPGVAELLLQEPDARRGPLSGARSVHPVDEAQEHAAVPERRGPDNPFGDGVLRLGNIPNPIGCLSGKSSSRIRPSPQSELHRAFCSTIKVEIALNSRYLFSSR